MTTARKLNQTKKQKGITKKAVLQYRAEGYSYKDMALKYHIRYSLFLEILIHIFKINTSEKLPKTKKINKKVKDTTLFKNYNKLRIKNRKNWYFQLKLKVLAYNVRTKKTKTITGYSYSFDKFLTLNKKDILKAQNLNKKIYIPTSNKSTYKVNSINTYFSFLLNLDINYNERTRKHYNKIFTIASNFKYIDIVNFQMRRILKAQLTSDFYKSGDKIIYTVKRTDVIRYKQKKVTIQIPYKKHHKNSKAGLHKSNRKNKKSINHPFVAIDVETNKKGKFICGYVYGKAYPKYKNKNHDNLIIIDKGFTDKTEMQHFLLNLQHPKHQNVKLIAHNTQFDINYLREIIEPFSEIYNKGRFIKARLKVNEEIKKANDIEIEKAKKENRNALITKGLELWDFFNIIGMSLNNIIKSFKKDIKEKYNVEIDKPIVDFNKNNNKNILLNRCREDAKSLFYIVDYIETAILKDLFKAPIKPTISSISLTIFREKYLKHTLQHHEHETLEQLKYTYDKLKPYYFGGKVEVFDYKKTNYICYDVNSLYPSVMKNFEYPILNSIMYIKEAHQIRYYLNKGFLGFLTVDIKAPLNNKNGLIPVRYKNKLLFPKSDIKHARVNSVELNYALEHGYEIEKIYPNAIFYRKTEKLFKDFVNDLYKLRKEYKETKQKAKDIFIKYILNSLYGKFAQKIENTNNIFIPKTKDISEINIKELMKNNKVIIKENKDFYYINISKVNDDGEIETNISPYSFIELSSFITAYARRELNKAIDNNIENIIYCDTDSIFLKDKAKNINIDNSKLGCWSIEHQGNIRCYAPKNYRITTIDNEEIIKIKGVPKTHIKITKDNYKEYIKNLSDKEQELIKQNINNNDNEIYIFTHCNKIKESIIQNKNVNAFEKNIKIVSLKDKKRITEIELSKQ